MKLKKVTAILLTAVMTAALAACGSSSGDSSGSSGDDAGGSGTYTIGICQQMEHAALDAATKGFRMPAGSCLARTM